MGESGGSFSGTTAPSMRSSGGDPVVMCMSLAPFSIMARSNWCRLTLRPSSGFIFVRSRSGQGFAVEELFGVGAPKLRGGAPLNSLQRGGGEAPDDRGAQQLVQIDFEAFVRVHLKLSVLQSAIVTRRISSGVVMPSSTFLMPLARKVAMPSLIAAALSSAPEAPCSTRSFKSS